jgi:hypothetical protein
MSEIQKIDSMIQMLKDMKKDKQRLQKLSSINAMELTPKQANKRNADSDWIGMANIKRKHELHALAVELDFAERRKSYEKIEITDGWHRYNYKPREPNAL